MRGVIHTVTVNRYVAAIPDEEGLVGEVIGTTFTVRGRVVPKTGKETDTAGRYAEDIDGAFICPNGTDIKSTDEIVVSGIDPALDNTYQVMYVLYTSLHLECYIRVRGQVGSGV